MEMNSPCTHIHNTVIQSKKPINFMANQISKANQRKNTPAKKSTHTYTWKKKKKRKIRKREKKE